MNALALQLRLLWAAFIDARVKHAPLTNGENWRPHATIGRWVDGGVVGMSDENAAVTGGRCDENAARREYRDDSKSDNRATISRSTSSMSDLCSFLFLSIGCDSWLQIQVSVVPCYPAPQGEPSPSPLLFTVLRY